METKTTPVHPLLPGTSVECRGRNYRVIEGPDNLGFYALYGADFRAVFHATESELTVLSAPPSLAAENALLADRLKEVEEVVDRLKKQVELCDYRDGLDHELRMNAAYLDLITIQFPTP